VRDDRRLLGIIANLANIGVCLGQQTRRRPHVLQGRVPAQARSQPTRTGLAIGKRTDP
jgi:hypothetical protein